MSEENQLPEEQSAAAPLDTTKVNYSAAFDVYKPLDVAKSLRHLPLTVPNNSTNKRQIDNDLQRVQQKYQSTEGMEAVEKRLEPYVEHQKEQRRIAPDSAYTKAAERESAMWKQRLDKAERPVGSRGVKHTMTADNANRRSGSLALQAAMGFGRPFVVTLPMSCLVLEISGFKPMDELSTANRLLRESIDRGWRTMGMSYRSYDHEMVMSIVDYILDHVTAANIIGYSPGDTQLLKELIVTEDLEVLIAGSRAAAYPQGYPVVHHCDEALLGNCNYEPPTVKTVDGVETQASQLIDFGTSIWYDDNRISEKHQRFLSAKMFSRQIDEIKAMQKEVHAQFIQPIGPFDVDMGAVAKIAFQPKFPNLLEYETAASEWSSTLKDSVNHIINGMSEPDPDRRRAARQQYDNEMRTKAALRADQHFIHSIEVITIDDETFEITESSEVRDNLAQFEDDAELVNNVVAGVAKWRTSAMVSLVAVANWACPECGKPKEEPDSDNPIDGLVPYSALHTFFTTMAYRIPR